MNQRKGASSGSWEDWHSETQRDHLESPEFRVSPESESSLEVRLGGAWRVLGEWSEDVWRDVGVSELRDGWGYLGEQGEPFGEGCWRVGRLRGAQRSQEVLCRPCFQCWTGAKMGAEHCSEGRPWALGYFHLPNLCQFSLWSYNNRSTCAFTTTQMLQPSIEHPMILPNQSQLARVTLEMAEVSQITSSIAHWSTVTLKDHPHIHKKNCLPVLLERSITWIQQNPLIWSLLLVVLLFAIGALAIGLTYNINHCFWTERTCDRLQ